MPCYVFRSLFGARFLVVYAVIGFYGSVLCYILGVCLVLGF